MSDDQGIPADPSPAHAPDLLEYFTLLVEATGAGTWSLDLETGALVPSPEAAGLLGLPSGAATVEAVVAAADPRDRDRVVAAFEGLLGPAPALDLELRVGESPGRWVRLVGRPAAGRRVAGVAQDVTERRRAHERLKASEAQSALLAATATDAILTIDEESRIVFANAGAGRVFGYGPGELLGRPLSVLMPDRLAGGHHEGMRRYVETGVRTIRWEGTEFAARRKDGTETVVEISFGEHAQNGRRFFTGVARDVADRRRAEDALRSSEELNRRILETVPCGVVVVRPDGEVASANAEAQRILGLTPDALTGRYVSSWDHTTLREDGTEFPAEEYPVVRCLATGEPQPAATIGIRKPDGEVYWAVFRAAPLREPGGGLSAALVTFVDVTGRRQLEAQFLQAQKMEAVGRLAGGVAHDFNNLLTVIIGYAENLERRLGPADPLAPQARQINDAAARAAELTRQLLAFSRKQFMQPRVLDLNALVARLEPMLGRLIGADVALETRLEPGLARVRADPGQLEQVVVNLVVNARDAMPGGGRLTIATAGVAGEPGRPGGSVRLSVRDTGTGMDEATRARLFEPFFTTKDQGKGTGLGLSTVYGIVTQSGGAVEVASAPGAGTEVTVTLPGAPDDAEAPEGAAGAGHAPAGSETILLVEDQDAVRRLARETLESAGYRVVEAADGVEGLAALGGAAPDLVLTDVVMPRMNGVELAERVRAADPHARILYMTGYMDGAVVPPAPADASAVLEKPFTPAGLLRAVRAALDA